MNSFKLITLTGCFLLLTAASKAASTISFDGSFQVGKGLLTNLANASGTVTNGMKWGIIVSTTDTSFSGSGLSYDAYAGGTSTAGFLSYGGSSTDDYFIPGTTTVDSSGLTEGDFVTTGGNGGIVDPLTVPYLLGVNQGDPFMIVWFSSNTSAAGDKYGVLPDVTFSLPADGTLLDDSYATAFVGTDPVRTASNTFQNPTLAPEPSRVMFLALGGLGLLMRRRRA
jgi:hypothetical protein